MKLSAHGLHIELVPVTRADSEEWARVRVIIRVSGFQGDFEAWLQSSDLQRFAKELATLYQSVGKPAIATLASAEPDIQVTLTMHALGSITGKYALESERPDGVPTVLSGAFALDQSYLPELQQSVEALAATQHENNVP